MRLTGSMLALAVIATVACPAFGQPSGIRYAIVKGDIGLARKVVDSRPDAVREMNKADFMRQSPLHLALNRGRWEIATILIEHGADVNAKDRDGRTPLHCCDFREDLAALLIAKGANVNAHDKWGITPLHFMAETACRKADKPIPQLQIAKLLIAKHATMNAKDDQERTPLHLAALKGNYEIARLLLSSGANVNARNAVGETPLHMAAQYGQKDIVELLIKAGADVNARADTRHTARTTFGPKRQTPLSYSKNQTIAGIIRRAGGTE